MDTTDIRRRVAEALGWRVVEPNEILRRLHSIGDQRWVIFDPSGKLYSLGFRFNSAQEAWNKLLIAQTWGRHVIPYYDQDPAAALALLAGVRYTHEHYPNGQSPAPMMPAVSDRVIIVDEHGVYPGNGNTFAAAATSAWLAWQQAARGRQEADR